MNSTEPHVYQVSLPVFQGPLDLLLHLIERQELDITRVSLARVTNQFLEYMAQLSERDPDSLVGFLVIAAKLLVIKSRSLLPQPPAPSLPAEEDTGEDLVQQLIEYRMFKEAGSWLRAIEDQGRQSYIRLAPAPRPQHIIELGQITIDDLLASVRQALQLKPPEASVDDAFAPLKYTVAEQMQIIGEEIARSGSVSFLWLMRQAASRLEIIVTLLAVLEMVKQQVAQMSQSAPFGDILISARQDGTEVGAGTNSA